MSGKRGGAVSQLAITNGYLLRNERASTGLVVEFGMDGHVQRMHWEDALTAKL